MAHNGFRPTHCSQCGGLLTPLQRVSGTTCSNFKCRIPLLQEKSRRDFEQYQAHLVATVEKIRSEILSPEHSTLPIVLVPQNVKPLVPLPEERRQKFLSFLAESLAEGRESLDEPNKRASHQLYMETLKYPTTGPLTLHACITCGGKCCNQGETHAFLFPDVAARKILSEPQISDSDRIANYEAYLPEVSYEDSCVFHTESGCALPRQMRGETCNAFLCKGIREEFDAALDLNILETVTVRIRSTSEIDCVVRSDAQGNRIIAYPKPELPNVDPNNTPNVLSSSAFGATANENQ